SIGSEVMDTSTDSRTSPGNSQAPKVNWLIVLVPPEIVKESLITKLKLMVHASVVPLMGPLLYRSPALLGTTKRSMHANAAEAKQSFIVAIFLEPCLKTRDWKSSIAYDEPRQPQLRRLIQTKACCSAQARSRRCCWRA